MKIARNRLSLAMLVIVASTLYATAARADDPATVNCCGHNSGDISCRYVDTAKKGCTVNSDCTGVVDTICCVNACKADDEGGGGGPI